MANDTWLQPALAEVEEKSTPGRRTRLRRGTWVPNPVVDGRKHCRKCQVTKPVAVFSSRGKGRIGLQAWCKVCMSAVTTERCRRLVRERRGLALDTPKMQGQREPRPEGYTFLDRGGYKLMKASGHHRADRYGWVRQHIVVAEAKYGIEITRDFTVHHINGDRADNRPENLDLRWGNHGKGADVIPALLRLPEMRAVARAVLAQYDD